MQCSQSISPRRLIPSFFLIVFVTAPMQAQRVLPITHAKGAFVEVNGAKLWYESEGQGQPLVFIAGGAGAPHYFEPYFFSLSKSHRLIYFDSFGRGKSDRAKNKSEYTFDRDVKAVEGLRKVSGLGKIDETGRRALRN